MMWRWRRTTLAGMHESVPHPDRSYRTVTPFDLYEHATSYRLVLTMRQVCGRRSLKTISATEGPWPQSASRIGEKVNGYHSCIRPAASNAGRKNEAGTTT